MSEKNLRAKIIRLAHAKPELRKHLLPLVTESTSKKTAAPYIQYANDENHMVGTWLLNDRLGKKILAKARNARDLEKLVRGAHKKNPIKYLAEEGDPDEGIDWVTFGDLWQTLENVGSQSYQESEDDKAEWRRQNREY